MNGKIAIFGSYVTDLSVCQCGFPKEGETLKGHSFAMGPGGKGSNQAVAAHKAGADVRFITKIGDDVRGDEALRFYRSIGMNTDNILISKGGNTGAALIMVDEETRQNRIIVYSGACGEFTKDDTAKACEVITDSDILLTQLETNIEPVYEVLKCAHENGIFTIVDPAPACSLDNDIFRYIDLIKPNETEAGFYSGVEVTDERTAKIAADYFKSLGVKNVIITLGKEGSYVDCADAKGFVRSIDCGPVVDTTGAGDAFSGGLAAGMAKGMPIMDAVRFATITAGLSVTKRGTAPAMPSKEAIEKLYAEHC